MEAPFVIHIPIELYDTLKNWLCDRDFQLSQPNFTVFQAKSRKGLSVCCTLYSSGKLVIQGKQAKEFVTFHLEPEILFVHAVTTPTLPSVAPCIDLSLHIGTDESGKGDFFGPLCIAGAVPKTEQALQKLYEHAEIRDSKTIKNSKIAILSRTIRQYCFTDCIILYPEKYNALYEQFQNLNHLLAWGHATVIDNLASQSSDIDCALTDQFAKSESTLLSALRKKNKTIRLVQKTKAESDIIVASASIIAREAFLSSIQKLEQQHDVKLPLGTSKAVREAAQNILKKKGLSVLSQLCKAHFKTFQEIQ